MALPRILIVDDQFGGVRKEGRNRLREDLCLTVGLRDVTGDVAADAPPNPVGDAVFCRGQVVEGGYVRNDPAGTIDVISKGWQQWPRWALVLIDMQFKTGPLSADGEPGNQSANGHPENYFGMTLLEHLWRDPILCDIPVVILSSMSRTQIESRFVEHGVFDFVDKNDLKRERLELLLQDYGLLESGTIIGRSVPFLKCLREARQRAKIGNDNILLLGATGTGKELLARYIHDNSPRRSRPYVTVYTQGVPETLVDDRLFGHERGGYSGATAAQAGAAEEAHQGTLFIDEFGDLPALIQAKLLRLLDKNTRESQRMGAKPDGIRKLDLQVVLATNRLDILESEDFRKDLLFRVRVADAIRVPALRERRDDIPLLVEHFVRKCERAFNHSLGAEPRTVSPEAIQALCDADWPSNVRGLEYAIESAVYRFPKLRVLSAGHLRQPEDHAKADPKAAKSVPPEPIHLPVDTTLAQLIQQIEAFEFPDTAAGRSQWAGKLPELQSAFARAMAALLRAALIATRKSTPQSPEGELKIHPAVKLLTGDSLIAASKAADLVKRAFSGMPKTVCSELLQDPILKAAHDTAVRLRPRGSKPGTQKEPQGT